MLLLLALIPNATPYETDPITGRSLPLEDAAPVANAHLNTLLDVAAARTNAHLGCEGDTAETRRVLAREFHDLAAGLERLPGRGVVQGMGHSAVSAYLETAAIDRIAFVERGDIYEDLRIYRAPVLSTAGPCSTVRIGDTRVGTDKLYHFVDEGYIYFQQSREGADPDRAIAWGHRAESTVYGMWTSDAYSYADLRANWDGYLFYSTLLEPGSVVSQDDEGCVSRARAFDWRDWVDAEYDELYNPPVYSRAVMAVLPAALDVRLDDLCVDGAAAAIAERPAYVHPSAPVQSDVWQREALCEGL